MKKLIAAIMLTLAMTPALSVHGEPVEAPVREFRSAWVATVWRLDWPQTTISSTGNQSQIQKQKNQMIELLDSLSINNFNAVNFQVRSRADAMYKSSYEPWSSDLVDTRGKDPGWDPLEFVVAECHKRGMECHAWVNPYRFESVTGQWSGQPGDYRQTHPDWVMDVTNSNGSASILNPGKPEVTQHICNILREIVTNYDVDGILFDDYFYLSGTKEEHDGDLWRAYKDAGGTLSIQDWRRSNVNNMVGAVYSTIKSIKPWVRFGISPAGIACTNASVAASYGIPPCPTGSDWQYNDIYSDPIAWISNHDVDYISPQIYFTRGNSTAYGPATRWWSQEVAARWNRHVYVSHSISSLSNSSKAPGGPERASGPESDTYAEYAEQIYLNRLYSMDEAPGSIFYSAKYIYRSSKLFGHYLLNHAFRHPSLPPSMPWMEAPLPQAPADVVLEGTTLRWTAAPNMRYAVYAYASGTDNADKVRTPDYLLGMSYTGTYDIKAPYRSGYSYGVTAVDRFGNESSLALPGGTAGTAAAPRALYPLASDVAEVPFTFRWEAVEGASEYVVEISRDAQMQNVVGSYATRSTELASGQVQGLPLFTTLYWRVRALRPGMADGIGASIPLTPTELTITSPTNMATTASLQPEFTYSIPDREVTLEIATDVTFEDDEIVYTNTHTGAHTIPQYALCGAKHYYARARFVKEGVEKTTPVVEFTTPVVAPSVPQVAFPTAGGELHSDEYIRLVPVEGPFQFRIEVSASATFPPRASFSSVRVSTSTFTSELSGSEIKISSKYLEDGKTYYVHARARYYNGDGSATVTEYGEPVEFVYRASQSGLDQATMGSATLTLSNGILRAGGNVRNIVIAAPDGRTVYFAEALAAGSEVRLELAAGLYVVSATNVKPFKAIIY